jgi:hypothetical protein
MLKISHNISCGRWKGVIIEFLYKCAVINLNLVAETYHVKILLFFARSQGKAAKSAPISFYMSVCVS